MSSSNLKRIVQQLKSDKSKERQQALANLREAFSRKDVVDSFDPAGDGKSWLIVFQSLFEAVINERKAASRKGASVSASESRLKEAASTVRWLTEKSVTCWGMRVGKAIIKHLIQAMKDHGELYAPVALDCIKTLRVICAFAPHLNQIMMDESLWVTILSLSFAIVLGDDINSTIDDENVTNFDSSEDEVSLALSNDDDSSTGRKRKRGTNGEKRAAGRTPARTISPEQIECVSIIALFLGSRRLQLISACEGRIAPAVVSRLTRFFNTFKSETSAHLDAVSAVQAVLDTLTINSKEQTIRFAVDLWESILHLWSTKSRALKEGLVMIAIEVLPFLALEGSGLNKLDGFSRFLQVLQNDILGSRPVFDDLELSYLRLKVDRGRDLPFSCNSFSAAYSLTTNQVVSWSVVKLLSDVTFELHRVVESSHSSPVKHANSDRKRSRIEDPVQNLVNIVQKSNVAQKSITLRLQVLLFLVENHWKALHVETRSCVVKALIGLVTNDAPSVQSWAFLAIASIVYIDDRMDDAIFGETNLDSLWSHAMRRTNVPVVCRTACHLSLVLLRSGRLPLHRVHAEIEAMALDITVQGPSAPYDSVCHFLAQCIKVASQDTRLFRLRLDEKVVAWLIENWTSLEAASRPTRIGHASSESFEVEDIFQLLSNACGLFQMTFTFNTPMSLPLHPMVDLERKRLDRQTILDFFLHGHIPSSDINRIEVSESIPAPTSDLVEPDARIRRLSAFFLKTMEGIIANLEGGSPLHLPAQNVVRLFNFSLLTFLFEIALAMSGMRNSARMLAASSSLFKALAPCLQGVPWTHDELAQILSIFSILDVGRDVFRSERVDMIIDAGKRTGVRSHRETSVAPDSQMRTALLSNMWQCSQFQEGFDAVLSAVKRILQKSTAQPSAVVSSEFGSQNVDEHDGFGPVRALGTPVVDAMTSHGEGRDQQRTLAICTSVLSFASALRLAVGDVLRDDFIVRTIADCDDDAVVLDLLIPFTLHIRQDRVRLSSANLDKLLDRLEEPLMSYNHGTSDVFHALAAQFLHATMQVWIGEALPEEIREKVKLVYEWLSDHLTQGRLHWSDTRDAFRRLCEGALLADPKESFFEGIEATSLPHNLLVLFVEDSDTYVRCGGARSIGYLFASDYMQSQDPMGVYSDVRERLCTSLANYEHMLTRFLCLANVLVASSVVRRGPYWHLIETCLFTHVYIKHIERILEVATQKMGLSRFRDLFEAYATQIAYSIRLSKKDFFRLPPTLLGYKDRKECAESTFVSFSPTNLLASEQDIDDLSHETGPFAHHCAIISVSVPLGLRRCFSDIAASIVVSWIDENPTGTSGTDTSTMVIDDSVLLTLVHESFTKLGPPATIDHLLTDNVDSIVCSMLRMCGDMDLSGDGPIMQALRNASESGKRPIPFHTLTRYQDLNISQVHTPNLPAFEAAVVLKALAWLSGRVKVAYTEHTTYHVLQQLFADISQCIIINEQIRLLTALVVWICLTETHFDESATLLRVLMGGAATCLGQKELCNLARGIMEWAFERICDTAEEVTFLSEILLRCSAVADTYSRSSAQAVRELGFKTRAWIEQYVGQLWQHSSIRGQIVAALYAWPSDCTETVKALLKESESRSLSAVFDQPLLSAHRLKAIRNISAVTDSSVSVQDFAAKEFWRLKESIPIEGPTVEEIDAFSNLLLVHNGHIRGRLADSQSGLTIAALHLQYDRSHAEQAAKKSIIQAFLFRVSDQSSTDSTSAYHTLRYLACIEPLSSPSYGSWPSRFRKDVEYLDFCPKPQQEPIVHDDRALLMPDFAACNSFEAWICPFATFLCTILSEDDHFFGQLSNVMKSDVELAQQALPVLVYCLLRHKSSSKDDMRSVISKHMESVISSPNTDARCHRAIVDLVTHLRNFEAPNNKDPLGFDKWLDVNFVSLSKSAISCGAYTSALLFLELAEEYSQVTRDLASVKEEIMFEIYNHIDEPDGFYGIKSSDLQRTLLRRFRHEQQWDKAFHFHGALSEFDRAQDEGSFGVVESLHAFGFHKLALSTLQSVADHGSSGSSDLTYKLGWRTETWDLPDNKSHGSSSASLYTALRAVHRSLSVQSAASAVASAMSEEMQRLRALGNENLFEIRQVTQNLMCLAQIRRWHAQSLSKLVTTGSSERQSTEVKSFFSLSKDFGFADVETIIATRVSLLHAARQKDEREQIGTSMSSETQKLLQYEKLCFHQLAEAARLAHQPQVALNSAIRLLKLEIHPTFETQQELSRVLWAQKEQKTAVASLQKEVRKRKSHIIASTSVSAKVQLALALAQLGEWTSEACLEKAKFIDEEYFTPSIELLGVKSESGGVNERRAEIYYKYALFSEKQYHDLLSSDDIRRLAMYQDLKSEEIAERDKQLKNVTSDLQRRELQMAQRRARQLQKQDTVQLEEFSHARQTYLHQAIKMYANALRMSNSFDTDAAIRFCSLWFANFGGDTSVIGPSVKSVPSLKFIFLAHQLSARLSAIDDDEASSQAILQQLLYRMCVEHPFHSLYQVYLLQSPHSSSSKRKSRQINPASSQMERAEAASSLFDRLLSTNNSQRARDVKYVCDAYLQWAKYAIRNNPEFTDRRRGELIIPKPLQIRKVFNIKVPVSTARLPLDPSMRYEDCVWIAGYVERFETAGGVNVPKICFCKGSDGVTYKQLFKGEGDDDLRQDAVMEQVFELCNQVLSKDQETRRRDLSIRTYKVIPLAAQAGILEFVGKTLPLQWVVGAHKRYRPNDLAPQDFSAKLREVRNQKDAANIEPALITVFNLMRQRFRPVMRHFFTENRKDPQAWFEMRLAYSRSVAVTSIVGHLLGLGDRHLSNILLDTGTGEVVHIDLGIAFEQGRLLPIPERVPFRLTADIIDGFGAAGTEGVFRRCAEETLRVLREGSGVIKTVLEVFKYDPLHSWTVSAVKIRKAQGPPDAAAPAASPIASMASTASTVGLAGLAGFGFGMEMPDSSEAEAADRALSSVARKLDKSLSVEYTVNELTSEASDPSNLALMFAGWAPHC